LFAAISEGILLGLVLSVLTGPIFFTILQVSIEKGVKAGTALVAGQWISDYLYIGLTFWGASYMQQLQADETFKEQLELYLGTAGSIFLAILGLILLLVPSKKTEEAKLGNRGIVGFLGQGFLINSLTPFPILFWISLMGSAVGRGMDFSACISLGLSVMLVVMLTDMIKVYAARYIRKFLTAKMIQNVRKGAGIALMLSGLILFIKVFFF
jgi:threonine/homoserine/homoserine lactone efflux protein